MATMFLMVGLPGAGKTTRAEELALEHRALRLTPDEWMIPLFGESEAGARDVLEGRLVTLALQVLRLGTDVVLDFGCWSRDERSALHGLALRAGAGYRMVYLPLDPATQLARIGSRWRERAHTTFPMSPQDLERWRAAFEVPDAAELAGAAPGQPPPPAKSWLGWAEQRWPSLAAG